MKGMRAVFRDDLAGEEPELWEARWEGIDLPTVVTRMRTAGGPLVEAIRTWTEPGQLVLEAGCGAGRIVGHLDDIDRRVVGLDFAARALARAKDALPQLDLVGGDVGKMPFADGAFDVVISLGVIEHFEEGLAEILAEHRRVLRRDGLLLLTVPRLSPLKRVVDFEQLTLRRRQSYPSRRGTTVTRVDAPAWGAAQEAQRKAGMVFYQYELSRWWIYELLRQSRFAPFHAESIFVSGESLKNPTLIRAGKSLRKLASRGTSSKSSPQPRSDAPSGNTEVRQPTTTSRKSRPLPNRLLDEALLRVAGRMDLVLARPA